LSKPLPVDVAAPSIDIGNNPSRPLPVISADVAAPSIFMECILPNQGKKLFFQEIIDTVFKVREFNCKGTTYRLAYVGKSNTNGRSKDDVFRLNIGNLIVEKIRIVGGVDSITGDNLNEGITIEIKLDAGNPDSVWKRQSYGGRRKNRHRTKRARRNRHRHRSSRRN